MSTNESLSRRRFLRGSALGAAAVAGMGAGLLPAQEKKPEPAAVKPAQAEKPQVRAYRTLGRTGFKVSDISSGGTMNPAVLKALLDAGVNYIDTAESYGRGQSETVTGNVVKEYDRTKLFITTKLAIKPDITKEEVLTRFAKCLERLQTPYVDCLMMHSAASVAHVKAAGFHEACEQLKKEGKLKHVGISNHGSQWQEEPDSMEKVLLAAAEDGRFAVFLMVYNFIQQEMGERILKVCQEKNIGVTLMKTNPVGGYLEMKEEVEAMEKENKPVPDVYKRLLPKMKEQADKAESFLAKNKLTDPAAIRSAAVRFVLAHQTVHSVCCSCGNFGDVENYLALSGTTLKRADLTMLETYKQGCGSLYCRHACGLCEASCPQRVPVNTIMRYNHYFVAQGREKYAMSKYHALPTAKPDRCGDCPGHCQSACPYEVPVQGLLAIAHHRLTLA